MSIAKDIDIFLEQAWAARLESIKKTKAMDPICPIIKCRDEEEDDAWGSHIFYPIIELPQGTPIISEQLSLFCLHEPVEVILFNSVSIRCKHCDIKLDDRREK